MMNKGACQQSIPPCSPERLGKVALQGFFGITRDWGLSNKQQRKLLGDMAESTFHKYQKLPEIKINKDILDRISYIMGIHKALRIIFHEKSSACAWVKKPNTAVPFGGKSAIDFMAEGELVDLFRVRRYLDAWRGGI